MKKALTTIGIGNATVDTVLPSATVTPGDTIEAELRIEGGDAEQAVRRIDLAFATYYHTDEGRHEGTVDTVRLSDGFTIEPGASRRVPTTLQVPWGTPLTLGGVDVWLETELDVAGVDPTDRDHLDVAPTDRMRAVFDAAEALGLSLRTARNESLRGLTRTFAQEFGFRPTAGPFADAVDELALVLEPSADHLTVYVEVDRREGLVEAVAGGDEQKASFVVDSPDVDVAERELREVVEQHH